MHLSAEELTASRNQFTEIFMKALQDSEVSVRVSALKACSSFISGIDEQEIVLGFAPILPTLLDTVV